MKNKKLTRLRKARNNKGYVLSKDQILFLKYLKENKRYRNVLPTYKGMVTTSINKKKIINSKHLYGVKEAIKKIDIALLKRFDSPTLNIRKEIKTKIKPFNEIYIADKRLTKQQNHKKYLKSPQWKRKRNYLLLKRGTKCEICKNNFKSENLDLHHRTYKRWGFERQADLSFLCKNCHMKLHENFTIGELEEDYKTTKAYRKNRIIYQSWNKDMLQKIFL